MFLSQWGRGVQRGREDDFSWTSFTSLDSHLIFRIQVLVFWMEFPANHLFFSSPGIAIASALVDTSQQRVLDFKERGLGLKHRKHIVHHQGTCVWTKRQHIPGDCPRDFTRANALWRQEPLRTLLRWRAWVWTSACFSQIKRRLRPLFVLWVT